MKKLKMIFSRKVFASITTLMVLMVPLTNVSAQVSKVGTSAAAFLRIPVGARGAGLGGAIVATADDPSAMYWNPGGLARIEKYALIEDYASWFEGISINYLGVVIPLATNGTLGISISTLATKEIEVTTPSYPNGTGETYDAANTAVGISYAKNLTNSFSIGATVKYINERIYNSNATGFAFDIGTIYNTPYKNVRLGFSISNIGTKMQIVGEDLNITVDPDPNNNGNNDDIVAKYDTDKFDMPLIMRVGLAWDAILTESNRLTLAIDGINPNDNDQNVNIGAEFAFLNEVLILRAGYNELFLQDSQKGLAFGAGFNLKNIGQTGIRAEYGYQRYKYLGDINRYTLIITF